MATYVNAFQGYLADVPRVWFKTCQGKTYYYDELTQATVTPQVNYQEVTAGWSLFPVAYLPGAGTLEMSFTSAKFAADLYEMANGAAFAADASYSVPYTEYITPSNSKMILDSTVAGANGSLVDASSIVINGWSVENDFTYSNGTITINEAASYVAGQPITVNYMAKTANAYVAKVSNQSAAIGEAYLKWPVYQGGSDATGTGATGCTESAIKGYVVMHIFKCRVTTMPGFDTSYKSPANNQITLSAMDAKRSDNNCYELAYYPVA